MLHKYNRDMICENCFKSKIEIDLNKFECYNGLDGYIPNNVFNIGF